MAPVQEDVLKLKKKINYMGSHQWEGLRYYEVVDM